MSITDLELSVDVDATFPAPMANVADYGFEGLCSADIGCTSRR
jgi:hypothetical protein